MASKQRNYQDVTYHEGLPLSEWGFLGVPRIIDPPSLATFASAAMIAVCVLVILFGFRGIGG